MSDSDRTVVRFEDINISISSIKVQYNGGRFFPSWQASGIVGISYTFSGFGRSPERAVKNALKELFFRNEKEIRAMIRQK